MEEAEQQSRYVAQLRAEFDSCDTTSTGFLDRDELTQLCRKLQLDAHLPLLLDSLLGERTYGRVNFEEFKEGFVAVLSRSLDFSTSEDDSSYLEPVVPEEVKPKFVKGTKRYGRRSRPDCQPDAALAGDSEDSPPSPTEATDSSPAGVRRAKLRRSTSLESVESLKSDEEPGSQKDAPLDFQSKDAQREDVELEVVSGSGVCSHLSLQQLSMQELDLLLRKLDADMDGRVSVREFQRVLCGSAPVSSSTPVRATDLQRTPRRSPAVLEERCLRSASPSLLTATVGQRVLSRLDDGSGCASPERVAALWTEEGIRNSRDILQMLDFPLEERLSLADLTLALDNELLVSGNGIHQVALISYKNEIQHLQVVAEQACRERDKVKCDLDLADHRNLQLVREVDDRHASMETLNQSRIRDLEQDFRDRLAALRTQSEQESEALLQQVERERGALQEELRLLRAQEAGLQEELCGAAQENRRLEEELCAARLKLSEAESSVSRLQRDLHQLLQDKFGNLDPSGAGLNHEERISEIVKEYELQCRELQDRNDELNSELELLKSHRSDRKSRRSAGAGGGDTLSWGEQHSDGESDSDDLDMKKSPSPPVREKLQSDNKTALEGGPAVSIETELALGQLKQKHDQELQQLNIQLETQVNYYERSLERMRQSMEVERKDISQAFKMEISELEEQKVQAEKQVKQLREALSKVQTQSSYVGPGGWATEQERRVQRERAEHEQNFAREIGNLVQRLTAEKDQLEAELKLKMDQEVMLVREEAEQQLAQIKLHHAEGQRHLLHQLHLEHQRLQEQRGFWEDQLIQAEQDKLRCEERAGDEQKRLEEKHREESRLLREQLSGLQEVLQKCQLNIGQSEASVEEYKEHCGRLEEDLKCSGERCCELEVRLEEACAQLEESITFLESQEDLNKRLASEKGRAEEQLQQLRRREEQLLLRETRLKEELGSLQAESDSILQDREVVADNCSRLSNAFVQQQAQLRAKEQTVLSLRGQLEALQEAIAAKADNLCRLTAELDSLRTDRARLIQDLKEQAMAVDNLQMELDAAGEELQRRRGAEERLQEALGQEQSRASQLRSSLDEEREEVGRLSQENRTYIRTTDQLSTQIVEMEEEITTLRDHLRGLSSRLNETADLVPDLRRQLNAKTSEVERLWDLSRQSSGSGGATASEVQQLNLKLEAKSREAEQVREQVRQLTRAQQDSRNQLRAAEEDFDNEKKKMAQQLMELERLVLMLEEVMEPESPHRTELEQVRTDNSALQERVSVLQQEVLGLEEEVAKKRRKVEEMERDHERGRGEEERLHKENSGYREEVLSLSSRNLQLGNDNSELSARLRGEQESVRMLRERLEAVSKEQEEGGATMRRLQDATMQQEREKAQQQAAWKQEKHLLEEELRSCKDKVGRLSELEAELSSVTLKQQWLEEDKAKLLREAEERNSKMEKLQQSLVSLESEAEQLRSQLGGVAQEKMGRAQEATELQRKLQEAHKKVEELESGARKLQREKEELRESLGEQEERASHALQQETRKLRAQNQELQTKLSELQTQSEEVQTLIREQNTLKTKLSHMETTRTQAKEQAEQAGAALTLAQAQHVRELQRLQERAGAEGQERAEQLQVRLLEEQRRSQQLEETLRLHAHNSTSHISIKQEQYEKAMASLQQRIEDLESKLKGVRVVLQEKVQQLKEQLSKNNKSSALLKELYVENAQLMKALQLSEQRQRSADKKSGLLEEKVRALNKLLREIVPASLAT